MDYETRRLDSEILAFIRSYPEAAPDDAFTRLALKVFDYQYRRNAHYARFCRLEHKTPREVKEWKDIPAMPTVGFKELVLATFPIKRAIRVFRTSGTTQGARGAHFFDTLRLYEASILPPFKKYLLPERGRFEFFFLIPHPSEARDSSLSHMMGIVNRRFAHGRGKFYLKQGKLSFGKLAQDLRRSRKTAVILATALALKGFLDFLKAEKVRLKLPQGSRLMETGGFKVGARFTAFTNAQRTLYAKCERRLGIPATHCVSEYGMTELSSQFYDTTLDDARKGVRRKAFKKGPGWLRFVVINPLTGRLASKGGPGLLRFFDLANRGSVLAVQTEDLGRERGDGFEFLGRAAGAELRGCSLTYEEFLNG